MSNEQISNRYKKYCPNVWLAETVHDYERGDIIELTTKYGKDNFHYIHNLVEQKNGFNYYSITRVDGTNTKTVAERRSNKYLGWAQSAAKQSQNFYNKSNQHRDFLSLGEPIKIGHHSEQRHRKMIDNSWRNMGKSVEMSDKAEAYVMKSRYWASRTKDINLSNPESVEYFETMLEKAKIHHKDLKQNPEKRDHAMALQYAKNRVNEMLNKYQTSLKLWACEEVKPNNDS